jgi:hypothetical protein
MRSKLAGKIPPVSLLHVRFSRPTKIRGIGVVRSVVREHALLPANFVFVLHFHLVPVVFEESEVHWELVRVLRGSDATYGLEEQSVMRNVLHGDFWPGSKFRLARYASGDQQIPRS